MGITVLDKSVADKIAAGEVVERPKSIIKELVENSIDAMATSIIVEIKKGGKNYIRVSDNGLGILNEEVKLAFLRHATSKIQNIDDLDKLDSLGFRGEALASIVAVSNTEILTKTNNEKMGTKLVVSGSNIIEEQRIGCPNGTTIVVKDLFFNTPARRKFMKSDSAESTLIINFVTQIALAYPNIKVRMINNDNILFSTKGDGDKLKTIGTLYSKDVASKLKPFLFHAQGMEIEGYVSGPGDSRSNRKSQVFFVNGRVINSKVIEKGITQAYHDRLFEGRYPVAFLFIKIPPETMDVNIHPNKKEVRFYDESVIIDLVKSAIIEALNTKESMTDIKAEDGNFKVREENSLFKKTITSDNNKQIGVKTLSPVEKKKVNINNILETYISENLPEIDIKEDNNTEKIEVDDSIKNEIKRTDLQSTDTSNSDRNNNDKNKKYVYDNLIGKNKFNNMPFKIEDLRPIGQIFNSFIVAEDEDTMFIIDQHAAHERVFFESFLNDFRNRTISQQIVMIPFSIQTTPAISVQSDKWLKHLNEMGFEISEFGPNIFRVTAIPMFFEIGQAEEFLQDYTNSILDSKDFSDEKTLYKIATKACKAAVKANDKLSIMEIESLLNQMSLCENPFSCPHGRPTFIKMTKKEMEKRFKRT